MMVRSWDFSGADAELLPGISAILEEVRPLFVWL